MPSDPAIVIPLLDPAILIPPSDPGIATPLPDLPVLSTFDSLVAAIEVLGLELETVRREAGDEMSTRLATAGDELAAIQDEIQQQQEEIEGMLDGADAGRTVIMRRFLGSLPLATILTNPNGLILEANAAAHTVMREPRSPLPGKPIFAYVAREDRQRLRSALTKACVQGELIQTTAMLTPRAGTAAVLTHLALVREPEERTAGSAGALPDSEGAASGRRSVRWVILPDYAAAEQAPSPRQLEALTRLCQLRADPESDVRPLLSRVMQLCLQAISTADDASLVIGDPQQPTLTVTSSATAQHLDGVQHRRAGGPVLDAYRSRRPVALCAEAVAEHPGLSSDPQASAVTSLLAVPLIAHGRASGVLTLYTRRSELLSTMTTLREVMPFVEAVQALIQDTESHAEMRRTQDQLQTALTSRAVIDQAKGILMACLKCDADEAFEHLSRLSSTRHEKLREVAQGLVDNVRLQGGPLLPVRASGSGHDSSRPRPTR